MIASTCSLLVLALARRSRKPTMRFTVGRILAVAVTAGVVALYLEAHPDWTPDQIKAALLADATTGVVTGAGEGSPDRFLYVGV